MNIQRGIIAERKLQKRLKQRVRMVVPVKVFVREGSDKPATYLAHTLDATEEGVRLGGFHGQLALGETITVQYQHRRSRFRVVWVGKYGSPQGTQVGIDCLEPEKDIWQLQEQEQPTLLGTAKRPSSIMLSRWGLEPGF